MSGVITLTFDITGTPTLSLTTGTAFNTNPAVITSSISPWSPVVTYTVDLSDRDYPQVVYTAANTEAVQSTTIISYVRDITGPVVSILSPLNNVFTGTTLVISGTAVDDGAGLSQVGITTGTEMLIANTSPWQFSTSFPSADGVTYTLTFNASDHVSAATTITRPLLVDNVPPTTTIPMPHASPWVTSTLVYTWIESYDGSGIANYHLNIMSTAGYSQVFSIEGLEFTFPSPTVEGVEYSARLRAEDAYGNLGPWSPVSSAVIPDLTPPSILHPSISKGVEPEGSQLYIDDLRLYYRHDGIPNASFGINGYLSDTLSGGYRSIASAALNSGPYTSTEVHPVPYSFTYYVSGGSQERGEIIVTGYDVAGNSATQVYTFTHDNTPPASSAEAPTYTTSSPIVVDWEASDEGCGVYSTTLWYRVGEADWIAYDTQENVGGTGSFDFIPPPGNETYDFATTTEDNLGNVESLPDSPDASTRYVEDPNFYVYLPVVMRDYAPFINGDFETGTLLGWRPLQDGFQGPDSSGLPQDVITYEGSYRALLGDPGAGDGNIPVGYGGIAQTFTVEKPRLQLRYRVLTHDFIQGANDLYYDTFEISVNAPPETITDGERDTVCQGVTLNPTGEISVNDDGLAICGGRPYDANIPLGTLDDSGWKTVILDLSAFEGENVTLYVTIWGREYQAPDYNDKGWYNTWAYVDDLAPQD
ncbi:MAG: Ig-like domain-containing protein [Anaerolineae bacterium]